MDPKRRDGTLTAVHSCRRITENAVAYIYCFTTPYLLSMRRLAQGEVPPFSRPSSHRHTHKKYFVEMCSKIKGLYEL